MATAEINAAELPKMLLMKIRVKGAGVLRARLAIGTALMRLGAHIIGTECELDIERSGKKTGKP